MTSVPVLLDTDIGSDIDDALALSYLLCQPRCALLGITTVTGQPDKRATLAEALCRAAGRNDIPIHVGTERPLLGPLRQPDVPQAEALTAAWPHRAFPKDNTAIEFLRRTIRARPGEITLLTIGPLTNIALLLALDPEIPVLLPRIVMMGGQYYAKDLGQGQAEWNILNDPHAAAIVFQSGIPITAVGLDVTATCRLSAGEFRQRLQAARGPMAPTRDMAQSWFQSQEWVTFHDPLAAALIFEPALCSFYPEQILVDLTSSDAIGQTRCAPEPAERWHDVAHSADPSAFFAHYFSAVGGSNIKFRCD